MTGRVSAMFPGDRTPRDMPDLTNHSNYMSEALRAAPEIYHKLKDKVTSKGVTLAKCMKTGVDNEGHPHIKTVGLVAGDEESYTVFKDLFDPVSLSCYSKYVSVKIKDGVCISMHTLQNKVKIYRHD